MANINERALRQIITEAVNEYVMEVIDPKEPVTSFLDRKGIKSSDYRDFEDAYNEEQYGDFDDKTPVTDYLNRHPELDSSRKFDKAVFGRKNKSSETQDGVTESFKNIFNRINEARKNW